MGVGFVLATLGGLAQTLAEQRYGEQQQEALQLREEEEKLAATQQANKVNKNIERIIGKQIVYAGSSGLTPGSFAPIEERDFDEWAQDRNAINLNLQFKELALDSEMNAISSKMAWAPILNLFGAGQNIYNMEAFSGAASAKAGKQISAERNVGGTINAGQYYGVSQNLKQKLVE